MATLRDKERSSALNTLEIMTHRHGLGGGCGLIQHRGISDRHAGQVADHRLEIHQSLHAPLRDLGLVWRVGRVPAGILKNITSNHRRQVRAVISHPNIGGANFVPGGNFT